MFDRPHHLIVHLQKELFSEHSYREEMAYLRHLSYYFDSVITLKEEVLAPFLKNTDLSTSICVTTSAEVAAQMMGLGVAVIGFETQENAFLQAPYVVLSLEQISYRDLVRIYQRAHGIPWTILSTKRCIVREFAMRDLDNLFELYSLPGISDYVEPLYPYEQEKRYEENYIQNIYKLYGFGMWLVYKKETGRLIGRAGIEYREPCEEGEVEMGYLLAPDVREQGIATEVCSAILSYAKEELCMKRVLCKVDPENIASLRLLQKLGFEKVEDRKIEEERVMYARIL